LLVVNRYCLTVDRPWVWAPNPVTRIRSQTSLCDASRTGWI
jgi:hypothetical protein